MQNSGKKKEEKTRIKEKITSLCVQTGMQISKNRKGKIRKYNIKRTNDRKTPQTSPRSSSVVTFTS